MKKFVLGFIVGALLFSTASVFAASGKMIQVFYMVKDIKINQVSKMPNNPEQKPFVYNGTTFVPLRFISENLGYPVKWDGQNQTIYIGETGEENAIYPGNGINHMNYQEGDISNQFRYVYDSKTETDYVFANKSIIKDNVGNQYDKFITLYLFSYANESKKWNFLEFPLNGNYKSFKAKVGLTDSYKSTKENIKVQILLDDKVVYEQLFKAGDFPQDVEIDTSNALKIQLKASATADYIDEAEIGFFNARFIK